MEPPRSLVRMSRKNKFPGLQDKFVQALTHVLADGRPLKGPTLREKIKDVAGEFFITDQELSDIETNFANYAKRAKDRGVVQTDGPHEGYRLSGPLESGLPDRDTHSTGSEGAVAQEDRARKKSKLESFFHLPIAVALSCEFSARVVSMPNVTDRVSWGNPDMLMLRPSPLYSLIDEANLDWSTFRKIDMSAECVLSSIEVKVNLNRKRSELFKAIAQSAANSRWANEAWLVFSDLKPEAGELDEDVVSLARICEVGVIEVWAPTKALDSAPLSVKIHHRAPTKTTLRIEELSGENRAGVLKAAQELLKKWEDEEEVTFLDVDTAVQKARFLLQHSLLNLRAQNGSDENKSLKNRLEDLKLLDSDRGYLERLLKATLRSAGIAAEVDFGSDTNLVEKVVEAAKTALVCKEFEAFKSDLTLLAEQPGRA